MSAMTRSPLLAAALLAAALGLGACGSSDDGGGASKSASNGDKAFEGALKFSKCMREHGIDMPDPQRVGTGGIKLTGGPVKVSQPKMKAAQAACQKYMQFGGGGGKRPSPAEQAKAQRAMLAYAKCMRSHGVDMPDPQLSSSGGATTFKFGASKPGSGSSGDGPGGVNPDSPVFKAADKACHGKIDALGPDAGTSNQRAQG
jgi:hypothetical protein